MLGGTLLFDEFERTIGHEHACCNCRRQQLSDDADHAQGGVERPLRHCRIGDPTEGRVDRVCRRKGSQETTSEKALENALVFGGCATGIRQEFGTLMHYCISDRQQEVEVLVGLSALVHLSAREGNREELDFEWEARSPLVQIAGLRYGKGALELGVRLMRIEAEALQEFVYEAFEASDGDDYCDDRVGGVGESAIARSKGDME